MRRQHIKTLARKARGPRGPGQLYFRAPGGPLHPIDEPEKNLDFAAVALMDGPLTDLYFRREGNRDFQPEEIAMIIRYVGNYIAIDPPLSDQGYKGTRGLAVEFYRGRPRHTTKAGG